MEVGMEIKHKKFAPKTELEHDQKFSSVRTVSFKEILKSLASIP